MVHVGAQAPQTSPFFKTYLLFFLFFFLLSFSFLFSALRGLIEQFKVILLQGPLIDFICVFSRGQGENIEENISFSSEFVTAPTFPQTSSTFHLPYRFRSLLALSPYH